MPANLAIPSFGTPLPSPSVPRNGSKTFEGLCGDQNTAARRLLLLLGGGGVRSAQTRARTTDTHTHTHGGHTANANAFVPTLAPDRDGPWRLSWRGNSARGGSRPAWTIGLAQRGGQRPTTATSSGWVVVACPRAPPSNPRVAAARLTWAAIDPRYSPSDTLTHSRNCHSRTHLAPVRSCVHEQAETRTG